VPSLGEAIDEAGDPGVIEALQDLALALEEIEGLPVVDLGQA
jgi:hypothetical protein